MARMHSKDVRVYLGSRDVSQDLTSVAPKFMADVHDTHTLGDQWKESTAGLKSWECACEGFYDSAALAFAPQLEALLGTTGGILTIIDDSADAVGDFCPLVGSDSILLTLDKPITVADMLRLKGNFKPSPGTGSTQPATGRCLHVLGLENVTGTGTGVDNAASSASGGRGNLHVTAVATPNLVIKVQHSTDDITYVDLITFTTINAGVTSETKTVSGTVNRYTRGAITRTAGSATYVLAFGRF